MREFRKALLNDPSHDLFGIVESRLGPEIDDVLINLQGYSVIRQNRYLAGGGVILYVPAHIQLDSVRCYKFVYYKLLFLDSRFTHKVLWFYLIVPNTALMNFVKHLIYLIESVH